MMKHRSSLLTLCLALAACSPAVSDSAGARAGGAPAASAQVHPVSGLAVVPLTVTVASGKHKGARHAFRVEVAHTGAEQARGLMFRTRMGPDEGMIFPMSPPRMASFWMRNTVIPLDIVFVAPDGRIINIAASATPYSEDLRQSLAPVSAVLELNGGRAAELGIGPGDKVEW